MLLRPPIIDDRCLVGWIDSMEVWSEHTEMSYRLSGAFDRYRCPSRARSVFDDGVDVASFIRVVNEP